MMKDVFSESRLLFQVTNRKKDPETSFPFALTQANFTVLRKRAIWTWRPRFLHVVLGTAQLDLVQ